MDSIWLYEKIESRTQKSECTSVTLYVCFISCVLFFFPALNLFLFFCSSVYSFTWQWMQNIFLRNCQWHFFAWHIHYNGICEHSLFSGLHFASAHTTYLHFMINRWLKWLQLGIQLLALTSQRTYGLMCRHRDCIFIHSGTW